MGIWQIVKSVFICFIVNQAVAAQVCPDDQLAVESPGGNVTCLKCPECPPGSGATAPCGGTVPYNTSVECQDCMPDHYSDSFSSDTCKPCSACMPDEVIVAKCTKISDTHCSCKPCPKGYYRNQTMSKCLPCSGCCFDGMDVVVPQCVNQGMPRTQSCSYQKSKPCRSKCWFDEMTVKKHGGKHSCLPCPVCSDEFGLTKPCGSFIYDDVVPKCERPTLGKTFINQQGILQSCKTCSTEEVLVNCSAKSDTICGGCKSGFYFNHKSKSCEECFWCCSHGDSQKIKNCIREGMLSAEFYHFPPPWLFLPLLVNDNVVPKYERPSLGKTFINQHGILQSCKTCSTEEDVLVNCSATSDTICGGCKPGFYFNHKSKSCEECFWCCSHGDSQKIMNCIREGMLSAEFYHSTLPWLFLPLQVNMQPHQVNQKEGYLREFLELGKSKVSPSVAVLIILLILVLCFFVQRRKGCENNGVCHENTDHEKMECKPLPKKHLSETMTETTCPLTTETKEVDSEYPVRHNSDHKLVFQKTGVELICLDSNKSPLQYVTSDFSLQAISDWLDMPGLLEDGELPLSPIIKFISSSKLDGPLEVQIPHGANMVLSSEKWKIILKELQNDKWVVVSDKDGDGIKRFVPKSNHVSFEADHLSTFAVVGYCEKHSLSALKRMKVVAFCSETRAGEDLVVRLSCFDDCEWSFEKLMQMELAEGGKLISSIESLDFFVTCEEDVEIYIKDSDGWKLESGCPMNLSYTSLRNSFSKIPQCNLVFKATSVEGNNAFFATIVLTQSSSQTVMYASAAIKENPTLCMNLNVVPNINEGVHKSKMGNTSSANQGEQKDAITDYIIQL